MEANDNIDNRHSFNHFSGTGLLARSYFYHLAPDSHRALAVTLLEKRGTNEYGYRKCGTHARVFSKTLEHVNSKNEIRQRNRRR